MKKFILSIVLVSAFQFLHAQADSSFKEYTGRYVFAEGSVVSDVTVGIEGNSLVMNSSAGNSELTKLGVDSFAVVAFSGTAVFVRDEQKRVKGVHIEAAGYVLDGKKEGTSSLAFRVIRRMEADEQRHSR